MNYKTSILELENTDDARRPHSISLTDGDLKHRSTCFDGLLVQWWKHFGLNGRGLLVGDGGYCELTKKVLCENFPEVESVSVVDLVNADIIWDITEPPPSSLSGYDWVICQAVLEHVVDPYCAVKHMLSILRPGGLLYIHTVSVRSRGHRRPVDCCRFFKDFFNLAGEKLGAKIEDELFTNLHVNVVYRRI